MAYGLKKIPVTDLKQSTSLGVKIPFDAQTVFTPIYNTKDQTKYNLINYLLTDKKERVFNPTFGAGLRSKLFDPIVSANLDDLKSTITSQIEDYFPIITVTNLSITGNTNKNSIIIDISYYIKTINQTDKAVINIQNL